MKILWTSEERIIAEASRLLSDSEAHREMAVARSPYGDGQASELIIEVLKR